jgi:predicted GNAT family acetyltransferase
MSDIPEKPAVINNQAENRFEARVDGHLARAEYIRISNRIILTHTEVSPALKGKGIASLMAKAALEYARAEGLKVAPLCPYMAGYIKRHPEYKDLLQEGFWVD